MKKLKNASLLALSLMLITVFSCENEPLEGFNLNNTSSEGLVGTWALMEFNTTVSTTSLFNGMEIESNIFIEGFDTDYAMTFTENSFSAFGSYSYGVDISVSGQAPMSTDYSLENVTGSGTYTTNGNEMTTTGSFFEFSFQGLDESVFQGEQTFNYALSNDGQTLTFTNSDVQTQTAGGASTTVESSGVSVWTRVFVNNTDCNDASTATASAENAYNNDTENIELCNNYKSALQNQINVCGDENGVLQVIIDGLGDCTTATNASIVGTWKIISLTSNGVEELQDELQPFDGCAWEEVYTDTTIKTIFYSGANCESINEEAPNSYTITGTTLVEAGFEDTPLEIIELSSTTLKLQDSYNDDGVDYIDIYTYERQ